jgi:uracil-DNA glycosylase family 4
MASYQTLEELLENLKKCRHCQEDFGYEPRPVYWGTPVAKIMHISQAPSKKVHEIGRPFSDLSGKKLREQWYEISDEQFYDGKNFYITTVGHCFPGKSGRNNYDRKPPKCCYEMWTKYEIELKRNVQLYLIVGGEAASRIFPGRKLTDLVFEDLQIQEVPAYVLPHPSPLNIKWFKDHPEFERDRLPVIRKRIHELID